MHCTYTSITCKHSQYHTNHACHSILVSLFKYLCCQGCIVPMPLTVLHTTCKIKCRSHILSGCKYLLGASQTSTFLERFAALVSVSKHFVLTAHSVLLCFRWQLSYLFFRNLIRRVTFFCHCDRKYLVYFNISDKRSATSYQWRES